MRGLLILIFLVTIGNYLHAQHKTEIEALNKAKQKQYEESISQYEHTEKAKEITEVVGCLEYKYKSNQILSRTELGTYESADPIDCRVHIYCKSGEYLGWYVSDQYEKLDLFTGNTQVFCENGNLLASYDKSIDLNELDNQFSSKVVDKVFPNPFEQKIHFNLNSVEEQQVTLSLIDMVGRTIQNKSIIASKGEQQLTLKLTENIPTGYYIFKISDATGQQLHVEKLEHIFNN